MSTNSSFSQNIGNSNLSTPADNIRQLTLHTNSGFQVIDESTNNLLSLTAGDGANQQSILGCFINQGDGNTGSVQVDANASSVQITIASDFNDGVNRARIQVIGSDTQRNINHTAIHHNFDLVEYATNAAALVGGLNVGDLYHTAGIVKIVI